MRQRISKINMSLEEKNTLILHHFESHWNHGLSKFGLSIENMSDQIIDFLSNKRPDINNIIITRFEGIDFELEHAKIQQFAEDKNIEIRIEEYAYSYYRESFPNSDYDLIIPTRDNSDPDNVLPVMDWQKELKEHKSVILAGAFEGECVRDMEDILLYTRGDFEKIDELVVGTYVDYEYVSSPEKVTERLEKAINDAERKYEQALSKNREEQELSKIEKGLNKSFFSNKNENAVKYYHSVADSLYSNIDEISDIISNIIMSGEQSTQYAPKMTDSVKKDLFNSFDIKNNDEKKHKNKLKI